MINNRHRIPLASIYRLVALICTFFAMLSQKSSHAAEYEIYSYHNVPPFITGKNEGLSYDLVRYLNKHGNNKFQFKLNIIPRKRLDTLLEANSDIIVPWVSPEWFGINARSRFLWTEPLLSDGNIYFSRKDNPIDIKEMADLNSLMLGGVLGHRYAAIDKEVDKGNFARTNAPLERNLIKMLIGERADIAIMAESSARYLVWEGKLDQEIYFSPYKHSAFLRRLLISGYLPQVHLFLDDMILKMNTDPEWFAIKSRYQLPIETN
ncbi:substrate-binding periplasmic protein [Kiloniella majae]|uniref:substrate-binding periplasmic protein n=1 Tax=Kiloniella majae TaxID=1938558 RepID=UPI000A279161|nr:transporter substrate-binding domain-containing protein [Kiloniella majae]